MQLMRGKKLFYRLMMLSHNILKLLRQQKKQSDKLIVFNRFLIYHSQDIHSDPGVDREQLFWQPLTIAQEKVISFWTCNISIFLQHCSSTQSGVLIHKFKWPPRQNQYILEIAVLISLKWNLRVSLEITCWRKRSLKSMGTATGRAFSQRRKSSLAERFTTGT